MALRLAKPALARLMGTGCSGGGYEGSPQRAAIWFVVKPGFPLNRALLAKLLPGLSLVQTKLFVSQLSRAKSRRRRWPSMVLVKLIGASRASRLVNEVPSTSCCRY